MCELCGEDSNLRGQRLWRGQARCGGQSESGVTEEKNASLNQKFKIERSGEGGHGPHSRCEIRGVGLGRKSLGQLDQVREQR